jgi:hypothetical protein
MTTPSARRPRRQRRHQDRVRRDEDAVSWHPLSVHDYLIDPHCEDWRERAVGHLRGPHRAEEEAEYFEDRRRPRPEGRRETYKNAANEELHGCAARELWLRPTQEVPDGFYACFVDDESST